jgi:hypothetical protein
MKVVRLSALCSDRLSPQEIFLLLISVRGWVNSRDTVWPEELFKWKFPMTPSGIEPATRKVTCGYDNSLNRVILCIQSRYLMAAKIGVIVWILRGKRYCHSSSQTWNKVSHKVIKELRNVPHGAEVLESKSWKFAASCDLPWISIQIVNHFTWPMGVYKSCWDCVKQFVCLLALCLT